MQQDLAALYAALGLPVGASLEQIEQAHRDLVKVWHPDRFAHDSRLQRKAEEKLKEINAAHDALRDAFAQGHQPISSAGPASSACQTSSAHETSSARSNGGGETASASAGNEARTQASAPMGQETSTSPRNVVVVFLVIIFLIFAGSLRASMGSTAPRSAQPLPSAVYESPPAEQQYHPPAVPQAVGTLTSEPTRTEEDFEPIECSSWLAPSPHQVEVLYGAPLRHKMKKCGGGVDRYGHAVKAWTCLWWQYADGRSIFFAPTKGYWAKLRQESVKEARASGAEYVDSTAHWERIYKNSQASVIGCEVHFGPDSTRDWFAIACFVGTQETPCAKAFAGWDDIQFCDTGLSAKKYIKKYCHARAPRGAAN